MSIPKPLGRISCTVPQDILAAADHLAAREQRSRSWVISEALRRYTAVGPVPTGLGPSRLAQLRLDLRLTPEERVIAAEETAALSAMVRPSQGSRLLQFERFEDYLDWKRREAAGR